MSGNESGGPWYPPPGHQEPQAPPGHAAPPPGAGYPPPQGAPYPGQPGAYPGQYPGQPPQQGWAPPPGMLGAAHKPGAMPLRPLGLGDIYDAAFRIIRFNPKATVGSSVMVAALAMAIPLVVTAVLTWTVGLSFDDPNGDFTQAEGLAAVTSVGSLFLGTLLQWVGTILVTGMIARVAVAAAIGRRLSLGEAWAETRGKRWRLVGLTLLLGLAWLVIGAVYAAAWVLVIVVGDVTAAVVWGLVTVPAFLVLAVWLWVRFAYLPVPALLIEDVGVVGSLRRAYRLTSRQFWRTFGIALLTVLVAGIAAQVVSVPLSFAGQAVAVAVGPEYALLSLVVVQAVSTVLAAAVVTPITTTVAAVQYLDQRMRKEAFDVELMTQAGITAS